VSRLPFSKEASLPPDSAKQRPRLGKGSEMPAEGRQTYFVLCHHQMSDYGDEQATAHFSKEGEFTATTAKQSKTPEFKRQRHARRSLRDKLAKDPPKFQTSRGKARLPCPSTSIQKEGNGHCSSPSAKQSRARSPEGVMPASNGAPEVPNQQPHACAVPQDFQTKRPLRSPTTVQPAQWQ